MRTIRREQIQVFQEIELARFRKSLAAHLEKVLNERGQAVPANQLAADVETGIAGARGFGIHSERDIARFVVLVVSRLGGFAGEPFNKEALNILYANGVDSTTKIDRLEQWAMKPRRETRPPGLYAG